MANRHLSRSIVLQSLFEWDFNSYGKDKLPKIIEVTSKEFAPGASDNEYIDKLVRGIVEKQKTLDAIIEKAAPDWPIDKISIVDRNVLRVGLFELLYANRNEVPPKVAINEAIELAKAFGGDHSGKFVNGVLGTVYREIGEPGKDDTSKKEQDISKMPKEYLGGAVVYRIGEDGQTYLAFVHDVFGYWTLSKGRIEDGEDIEVGAKREVKEELGIDVEIIAQIGENEYTASDPEKGKLRKHVHYFLAKTDDETLKLGTSGGLDNAKWFSLPEVEDLKIYGDIVPIITEGIKNIK
tara:strand:- start:39721 stop:40602 length:882 start_codon:yes stop_codon:yes gene_type:complete